MTSSLEHLSSLHFKSSALLIAQSIGQLTDQLRLCRLENFTGQLVLTIEGSQAVSWNLYYQKGHLVWGTGGTHAVRRWCRQLSQFASVLPNTNETEENDLQRWNYDALVALLMQGKIQQSDLEAIARGLTLEIFFDLYQQWAQCRYSNLQIKFNYVHLDPSQSSAVQISVNETWSQALEDWEMWQQAGLKDYSPNHAPFVADAQTLKHQVLPDTYQFLITMMDGRRTLRDLAIQSNKNLLVVTKALLPYIQQGLIKLLEVADLKPAIPSKIRFLASPPTIPSASSAISLSPIQSQEPVPLIAYIDDYKEDGQKMNQILTQLGCQCILVQDPMQALPLLLEHQPSLIFLDLVMPIINGYEACAQIRRIARFKETPIIILTSSDGIIDRVRAKIVGSTDFLAKPIRTRKVQAILQKYLEKKYTFQSKLS